MAARWFGMVVQNPPRAATALEAISDIDGSTPPWDDYKPHMRFYNIPGRLRKKGMSEAEIAKIIGGNFLRVFKAVSKSA